MNAACARRRRRGRRPRRPRRRAAALGDARHGGRGRSHGATRSRRPPATPAPTARPATSRSPRGASASPPASAPGGSLPARRHRRRRGDRADRRPFPDVGLALGGDAAWPTRSARRPPTPPTPVGLLAPVLIAAPSSAGRRRRPRPRRRHAARPRRRARGTARPSSAQARLSARVLTTLPFGVLGLLVARRTIRSATPWPRRPGWRASSLGVALNVLGWWWMRHVIGGAG